ncbi:helix-turn-helix domain-containing protein [Kitasatospora sp. MAP5-34]|uniref:AraC-like ligand-binding domain-containing protein n=1 Tax=Kitasatospora sp. MAP5-34 TaxID=3035102 RepID=UPI002474B578|nr:helix-turn-helix domain-containing protein [Kitasatospora sp. MAP5-34]MDH6578218.1 AraC-like DNA-binding protein [Kitasatospora sp. MAP5-34]
MSLDVVLNTACVPDDDKLDYWNQALTRTLVPQAVTSRVRTPFSGRITSHRLGYLQVSTIEADPQRMSRTHRHIAQSDRKFVSVGLQSSGCGELAQDGRTAQLAPGGLVVYDTTRPYTLDQPEAFRLHVFQLPRRVLAMPEADIHRFTARELPPDAGVAGMLAPFLTALATAAAGQCSPRVGEQLAGTVGDLLAALITEQTAGSGPADRGSAGGGMALRVRGYVNDHLSDRDLSPRTIAAYHHISVRYLHRLFEGEGTTVTRWIQQRRLEECSRELARRGRVSPTVSSVAQRWGFVNAAHFSRVFRTAYGMSPREWRSATISTAPSQGALAASPQLPVQGDVQGVHGLDERGPGGVGGTDRVE